MIHENILDLIGNTPIIRLKNLEDNESAEIYVKLEKYNLTGSAKDRAALSMIEHAEKSGILKSDSIIIEPTSGNTGIALAAIGRIKGYKVIIVMPDTMSKERRQIIKTYGAELILTDGKEGMQGAINKAIELSKKDTRYFIPQQFENKYNSQIHYETTGLEIVKDLPTLNAFISGVGTGGTIAGIGKRLKEEIKNIKIYGVEPQEAPIFNGGKPGPHKIQGIGAGFIPKIYTPEFIDEVLPISGDDAYETVRILLEKQGLFLGISSGACICAAIKIAKLLGKGNKVLALSSDGGEKYVSLDIIK